MSESRSDFMVFNPRTLEEKDYWTKKLATPVDASGLRTDYPRPASFSNETNTIELNLEGEIHDRLMKLTKGGPFLLYTTMLAALKICLHKYTGGRYIVAGSPARLPETGSSGSINALAIVDNVSDELSFRELLMNVRQTLLDAYARQLYPYDRVVKDLGLDRVKNKCPLFDVVLVLKNIHGELPQVKNDLTITLNKEREKIAGTVTFNKNLFKLKSVERFANHLKTTLAHALENTDALVRDIAIYTETEKHRLLKEWNETNRDRVYLDCIPHLIEQQVEHSPQALAVASQGQSLSYEQLNARANQVARRLQELGVGPEDLVGVCLPRNIDSVVAMLAILKAGGAYVPLDPANPNHRLAFMARDAAASVIVTESRLRERLPDTGHEVLCLDLESEQVTMRSTENPVSRVHPENAAYAIYTSGSTGTPKAVVITHAGLLNLVQWHIGKYEVGPDDRATLLAAQGFDAAVWELWPYLVAGASVHVVDEELVGSGSKLMEWMNDERITISFFPTPLTEVVLAEQWQPGKQLKALLTGGDLLHGRPTAKQGLRLVNHYGPTENTVVTTCGEVETEHIAKGLPAIGRAVDNVKIYVLDAQQQLVGEGVAGEMYIGGASLARGYWQRPDLTAAHFVPDSLSDEYGSRLYRTGDLVRYADDGELEFLGRIDGQVKIRGYRIEPQEVELTLLGHDDISEVAVVARDDDGSGRRLIAYVVLKPGKDLGSDDLKQYLEARLPQHMLPSALVMLPFLPLSANGKVDRRALPAPGDARHGSARAYVAPRNAVEQTLVEIWSQVLGVQQVGVDDNFFELGGDSILSIQIIATANQKNLHFTAKQLFMSKTIGELAQQIGEARPVTADQGLVTGPVPLTAVQHWFFEQNVADIHHWNHAMLLALNRRPNAALFDATIRELLRHHDALRLRFDLFDSEWRQAIDDSIDTQSFIYVDLSALDPLARQKAIEQTTATLQASLDLFAGPLLRVAYFDEENEAPGKLLFIVHHLAVDGVSWRILLEDFSRVYKDKLNSKASTLPQKTTSFKYWAERLNKEAQGDEMQRELSFWLAQDGVDDESLPLDFPDGENLAGSARVVNVYLTAEETKALLRDLPATYGSEVNEVLLAALVEGLGNWTGRRTLRLTLEGHGREEIFGEVDLSRTVGWFTTIVPVCLDLSLASSLEESIKAVTGQLKAMPQRGIGYGMLKYLRREGNALDRLRLTPQPQVSFNYFGQLDQIFEGDSLFAPAEVTNSDGADEKGSSGQSAQGHRFHVMDVTAHVVGGRLQLGFIYSENLHKRATIERLAQDVVAQLREMISCSRELSHGGYAPEVFSRANLSEEELQILLAQVEGGTAKDFRDEFTSRKEAQKSQTA